MIILRSFLLKMRNVSDKFVEKIKTRLLSSKTFFLQSAIYEIMWINILQPSWPQITIWRIRIAFWWLRLQSHSQNMQYLLLFQRKNGNANAPQCYVIRKSTLPVLFFPRSVKRTEINCEGKHGILRQNMVVHKVTTKIHLRNWHFHPKYSAIVRQLLNFCSVGWSNVWCEWRMR
jgi:hypothetical protein